MKTEPYPLATDGSNDEELIKMNPLTVQFLILQKMKFPVVWCRNSQYLFSKIVEVLSNVSVSLDNCVRMGMDNTSVNLAISNLPITRVLEKNNSVYVNGYSYLIVQNTAKKGASSFALETDFDIGDMLVDVFHWFDKNSKRKNTLKDFCKFMEQEYKKQLSMYLIVSYLWKQLLHDV